MIKFKDLHSLTVLDVDGLDEDVPIEEWRRWQDDYLAYLNAHKEEKEPIELWDFVVNEVRKRRKNAKNK